MSDSSLLTAHDDKPIRAEASDLAVGAVRRVKLRPRHGWQAIDLQELWQYRELLWILALRDVKVRYKQTVLGVAWAVIQPFFTMLVFSLFFGRLAKVPSDGVPYPIFSYAALVPWNFFANGLSQSSDSLVGNANLLKKVYFPRLAIPIGAVLSGVIDFTIAFAVLAAMMLYYGIVPTIHSLWLPGFVLLALVILVGGALYFRRMEKTFADVV